MRKIGRILLYLILIVVVVFAGLLAYVKLALPKVADAPDIRIEMTQGRIMHGKYLANSVAVCMDCHSMREWGKFSGPPREETLGAGGEMFDQRIGFPGSFPSKNITPYTLDNWTDGEILRAITAGVSKDGKALFPIMPYHNFGKADREDIYSIIAYLRTIKPVKLNIPASKPDFPMNFIINLIPEDPQLTQKPDPSDKLKYGEYMVSLASCIDCHTILEKGKPAIEMAFAGGRDFPLQTGGTVYSANITPDPKTGIGAWTEANFIQRFKSYEDSVFTAYDIGPNQFNTVMPWMMYAGMKEEDLSAMYAYLQSLAPIKNKVERFVPK